MIQLTSYLITCDIVTNDLMTDMIWMLPGKDQDVDIWQNTPLTKGPLHRNQPMDDRQYKDTQAIEQLLSSFAWHADRGEGEMLSQLFLPDGVLFVGGQEHRGRKPIADDCCLRAAAPQRKTRHVWSNLRIVSADENHMVTTAIQLTYEQPGADQPTQLRINDMFDEFAKDADGAWRFSQRTIRRELALTL